MGAQTVGGSGRPALQVADHVLDLGLAAMIGLEGPHFACAVADERVELVQREEREFGTRRRLHRRTMSRTGCAFFSVANGVYVA